MSRDITKDVKTYIDFLFEIGKDNINENQTLLDMRQIISNEDGDVTLDNMIIKTAITRLVSSYNDVFIYREFVNAVKLLLALNLKDYDEFIEKLREILP